MTVEELSNEFDTMLSIYSLNDKFGEIPLISFDEYEKSVFLTKALDLIIIELYSGRNTLGESFESTEEVTRYLRLLVKSITIKSTDELFIQITTSLPYIYTVTLDSDCLFITSELGYINYNGTIKEVDITPVKLNNYYRTSLNPFRKSNSRRVLRLDYGNTNSVKLISDYTIDLYIINYLSTPNPIILTNILELLIKGKSTILELPLPEILYSYILERAVQLALASKTLYKNNG